MKIAIDAREMVGAIAGKGRYVVELVKALASIDKENTYYLYSKEPIDVRLPDNFENVLIGGSPGLRQLWLASDVKQRSCNVLLSPTGYLPTLFSFVPTVTTIHDLALFITKDARPTLKTLIAEKLLLGLAVKKSKKILAVSQSTKDDLVKLFKVPAKKINVTLLGYDRELYKSLGRGDQAILESYTLDPNYLLFIGTLEPRKNITGIIQAYSQLSDELREQYPLVIAGKKGWFYEEIFARVEELKLTKQIKFLGRVPDEHLPALYRQAKVFVFPSFYEGFGLPPLEALASGTPVITSNISSLPEVVGEAGRLVDPTNPDQLAIALREILTDEKLYRELSAKTVDQADTFDWQKTASQTLEVLTTFK